MSDFKQQFSQLTSEYLLQMRARGDELSHEAHQAIEEIFVDRGEHLPPRPTKPIFITTSKKKSGAEELLRVSAFLAIALFVSVAAHMLAHTWIGVVFTLAVVIYLVAKWFRRQTLPSDKKAREDEEKKIADEGLTEMMVCAANGDLVRIRELVSYGVNVNDRSASGTTALMYAARNNQLAVVEFLLSSGADRSKKTDKNSTALDIAKKHGHYEVAAFLEKYAGV
jgi:uncharacterized protein